MCEFSISWGQLRTERVERAVGWTVGAGRMLEDAEGHTGALKATRRQIMEQNGKLRSLNKSHNYNCWRPGEFLRCLSLPRLL